MILGRIWLEYLQQDHLLRKTKVIKKTIANLYKINAQHFSYYIKAESSKKFKNNSFNSVKV